MQTLKARMGDKIHTRQIQVTTFAADEDHVIVEGVLKDDRLIDYYVFQGGKRGPGTIHHLIIRLLVGAPDLRIEQVEVEMPCVPRDECPKTAKSLARIEGLRITSGFTEKIQKRIGGANGCAHLNALLKAMASAAVQGFWTYHARRPLADRVDPALLEKFLVDTCYVWRQDGPMMNELKARSAEPPADGLAPETKEDRP